jgi:hypothetical protein
MRITTRLVITAIAALAVLALYAGAAAASTGLSISPSRGLITLTNSGAWTFTGKEERPLQIICARVQLLLSLATESIRKAAANRLPEGLIGWVTQGTATECRESVLGSEVRVEILARKTEMRTWFPLLYKAFLGTLPAINGILIVALNAGFSFRNAFVGTALYTGNVGNLISLNARQQTETNRFLPDLTRQIEPRNANFPPEGVLIGRGTIAPTLTIRLI